MSVGTVGSSFPMGGTENISRMKAMQEELFSKTDTDGNGSIDKTEFSSFFESIQDKLEISEDAEELFAQMDSNSDGSIDASEHAAFKPPKPPIDGTYSPELVRQTMLQKLDTNGDGVIDQDEMAAMVSEQAEKTGESGPSVEELFAQADTNGDGVIDAEEDEAMAQNAPPPPPRMTMSA